MPKTFDVTGKLITDDAAGTFSLTLAGTTGAGPGPGPGPNPPPDTIVLKPTGGDDTGKLQTALNDLQAGQTLMLSGMFDIRDTVYFDGFDKTLIGDPARASLSGLRATNPGMLSGPYGSLLVGTPTLLSSRISFLEFDAGGHATELVFFDNGEDNVISDCFLHDIGAGAGPPFAAIHSQGVLNFSALRNRVESTAHQIRGIWIVGHSGVLIQGNNVKNTGHTCIIGDASTVSLIGNLVENSLLDGTGMKMLWRSAVAGRKLPRDVAPSFIAEGNQIRNTINSGLMLESIGDVPGGVVIRNNNFISCGKLGTTFGALYCATPAAGVRFSDNRVEACKSIAGLRNLSNSVFERTTVVSGSNVIYFEQDCHNVAVTASGVASVGPNCSGIVVDGAPVSGA